MCASSCAAQNGSAFDTSALGKKLARRRPGVGRAGKAPEAAARSPAKDRKPKKKVVLPPPSCRSPFLSASLPASVPSCAAVCCHARTCKFGTAMPLSGISNRLLAASRLRTDITSKNRIVRRRPAPGRTAARRQKPRTWTSQRSRAGTRALPAGRLLIWEPVLWTRRRPPLTMTLTR